MLFFAGPGISSLFTASLVVRLPPSVRRGVAGSSGGALAALAVSAGEMGSVAAAINHSDWPGSPGALADALDTFVTSGCTFAEWCSGHLPLAVLMYDCGRKNVRCCSAALTPGASVAKAVAGAAAWPSFSADEPEFEGSVVCDAEFMLSPLSLQAALKPSRLLLVRGGAPGIADFHRQFAETLAPKECFQLIDPSGPGVLESFLSCRRASVPRSAEPPRRALLWFLVIFICLAVGAVPENWTACERTRRGGAVEPLEKDVRS
jgi:hypothetical protein